MKRNILTFILVIFSVSLYSQPELIQVTIINSEPITGITNIQYDFSGTYVSYDISVKVSFDGDPYQPVPEADLSGDLINVSPGIRNITWNGEASFPNYYHEQTRIRITATPNFVCGDQITDIDGNVYNTVLIGIQCWMKENLMTTKDPDGNAITRYCYDDDPSNCIIYGGLYNWVTAMDSAASSNNAPSGVQGICPDGWHLPSEAEWDALTNYISSQPGLFCGGDPYNDAKAIAAQTNWQGSTNTCAIGNDLNANNATGFSALPGGHRASNGTYYYAGYISGWWSSREYDEVVVWGRDIYYGHPRVQRGDFHSVYSHSARCLRDY